jgi:hypothetical protein
MKCIFDPHIASASCGGCRRRGSQCISQELVEDDAHGAHTGNDGPSLVTSNPIETPSEEGMHADNNLITPVSIYSEPLRYIVPRKPSDVRPIAFSLS